MPRIKYDELSAGNSGETSLAVRERVQKARDIQLKRFKDERIFANSEMSSELTRKYCVIDDASKSLLKQAVERLHLSPRVYFRILKLSRTIADLAESEAIELSHLAEALQYRPKTE